MVDYPEVKINGIDLFERYRAVLAEKHSVQPPETKTFYKEIPGADGAADLSTALTGRVTYNRREITMNFQCEYRNTEWVGVFSEILKEFHGKEGKIIFGDDRSYYYFGRMEVSGYERMRTFGKFTITMNAEPFKYELLSSLEPWLWGPFSLRNGVIRNYGNIAVNGTKILKITGADNWAIPVFIVAGNISVVFEEKKYMLKSGKSKIYSIVIKPGANLLRFEGTGTVSVEYRGGKL